MANRLVTLRWSVILALLVLASPLATLAPAHADGGDSFTWQVGRNDFFVTMSDGVEIDAVMIVPAGAQAGDQLAAIVAIHGYGGSKDTDTAQMAADNGYVGFAYSTRGFGQSGGEMDVVGPNSIRDLKELVAWLKANGPVHPDKVGVAGASYGGAHSLLIATEPDSGVAAVAPIVGWTDLRQALRPNDVMKFSYTAGFYFSGHGLAQSGDDPIEADLFGQSVGRRCACNTYDSRVHSAFAQMIAGVELPDMEQLFRERSAMHKVANINIPILIIQGLNDDLFPVDQVLDFFDQIPTTEKRMHFGYAGHPRAVQEGAEVDYLYDLLIEWFDYYLKGQGDRPIDDAAPIQVANNPWDGNLLHLAAWPDPAAAPLHALGSDGTLGGASAAGVALLGSTGVAGMSDDGAANLLFAPLEQAPAGTPLDTATFSSGPLGEDTRLLGTPQLDLKLIPAGAHFQVAVKIFDVGPDGDELVTRAIIGVRDAIGGLERTIALDMQPYHHVFAAGHHIEVRVATSDFPAYLPYPAQQGYALLTGAGGSTISLPLEPAN